MIQGRQYHMMADQGTVTDGDSTLILKVAAVVMKNSMSFTMDMKVVWLSVAFSVLIGVLFGLYPANKAASKKPIDALRYSG